MERGGRTKARLFSKRDYLIVPRHRPFSSREGGTGGNNAQPIKHTITHNENRKSNHVA
jgi:hypothetical protein